MEAPMKTWRESGEGRVLTEDMNGSKEGKDEDGAERRAEKVGIVTFEDGAWVGSVIVVIVGCPSQADAVKDAVGTAL